MELFIVNVFGEIFGIFIVWFQRKLLNFIVIFIRCNIYYNLRQFLYVVFFIKVKVLLFEIFLDLKYFNFRFKNIKVFDF